MESALDAAKLDLGLLGLLKRWRRGWLAGWALCVCFSQAQGASSVGLAWDSSSSPGVVGYALHYGVVSRQYDVSLDLRAATATTVFDLSAGITYYFAVTAYTTNGVHSDPSDELAYTVPAGNNAPTLNPLSNLTLNEDAGPQTVSLQGIGSGLIGLPLIGLVVTATSSNPALIPNPSVSYSSPSTTGSLGFAPAGNAFGTARITVTVNNLQLVNNLISRSFVVTVNPVNDAPTLNPIGNLALPTNAGPQTIALSGIGSGASNESQPLTITAVSSNPSLVPNPAVNYASGSASGTLSFTPARGVTGSANVTVTVSDGQTQNNSVSRVFAVSFTPTPAAPSLIYLEAESGVITPPMTAATNSAASNGRYVYSPSAEQGTVLLRFDVAQAGDHVIWGRILAVDNGTDSLYVSLDGGTDLVYRTSQNGWSPQWQWARVNDETTGVIRRFALNAGAHTLRVRSREASTLLDAVFITSDVNFVPDANFVPQRLTIIPISSPLRGMQISFPASSGSRYEVQTGEDLRNWTTFWTSPVATSNQLFSVIDPTAPLSGRRFYRTRLVDPVTPSSLPLQLRINQLPAPNFGVQIGFQPETGARYELEATEDFRTWTTIWISPVAASTQPLLFVDTTRTASGRRFYRVRPIEATAAGTEPLRVNIARVSSPIRGMQISFPAASGFRYAVQATEDMRVWTTIWSSPLTVGNRSYSIVDTAQTLSRKRFYRVQISN